MCDEADPPFNISTCDATAIEVDKSSETVQTTITTVTTVTTVVSEIDVEEQQQLQADVANFNGDQVPPTGSDSGVEVAHGEYASSGAPEPLSCASSLISCGSGCEDSFDILSCKNTDFKSNNNNGDGTSEGGSESSSITGSGSARAVARKLSASKKRVAVTEPGKSPRNKPSPAPRPTQGRAPSLATRERARSREKSVPGEKPPPPTGPKPVVPPRNRPRTTVTPDSLALVCRESPSMKVKATKTSAARCRTPGASSPTGTPSLTPRNIIDTAANKSRMTPDSKAAFDKYATLPRRKRENSPELSIFKKEKNSQTVAENSINKCSSIFKRSVARDRDSPPLRSLPPYPKSKMSPKIRIYHETSVQTALNGSDVENALAGVGIKEIRTDLVVVKKVNKSVQVDNRNKEIEKLEAKVKALTEANAKLQGHYDEQTNKLTGLENRLEEERADKVAAQEELQRNTQRVLSMLGGNDSETCGDSLMLLESQLQTSANIVIKQQEEINKLHNTCRELQQVND